MKEYINNILNEVLKTVFPEISEDMKFNFNEGTEAVRYEHFRASIPPSYGRINLTSFRLELEKSLNELYGTKGFYSEFRDRDRKGNHLIVMRCPENIATLKVNIDHLSEKVLSYYKKFTPLQILNEILYKSSPELMADNLFAFNPGTVSCNYQHYRITLANTGKANVMPDNFVYAMKKAGFDASLKTEGQDSIVIIKNTSDFLRNLSQPEIDEMAKQIKSIMILDKILLQVFPELKDTNNPGFVFNPGTASCKYPHYRMTFANTGKANVDPANFAYSMEKAGFSASLATKGQDSIVIIKNTSEFFEKLSQAEVDTKAEKVKAIFNTGKEDKEEETIEIPVKNWQDHGLSKSAENEKKWADKPCIKSNIGQKL
jgi:hypothetical protein